MGLCVKILGYMYTHTVYCVMGLCVKVLGDIHSYCVLCYGSVCEGTGIYTLILCIVLWVCV